MSSGDWNLGYLKLENCQVGSFNQLLPYWLETDICLGADLGRDNLGDKVFKFTDGRKISKELKLLLESSDSVKYSKLRHLCDQ